MEKFVLPERWFVKTRNDDEDNIVVDYINNTFKTNLSKGLTPNISFWYYSNYSFNNRYTKHDSGSRYSFNHATEITYSEFLQYVLNQKPKENTEYNEILIKLLNQ